MQIAFQDAFDRAGLDLEITSTELFKELNEAQDVMVSRLYREFEKDNQISAGIAPFVVRNTTITTTHDASRIALDGFTVDRGLLPASYRFFLALRAGVEWIYGGYTQTILADPSTNRTIDVQEGETVVTKVVPVKIVQQDDLYAVLKDPFSKPLFRSPVAVLHDAYVDAYADNSTFVIPTLYLDYVKVPDTISLDGGEEGAAVPSEFPVHLHREIVDLAVERYLQRVTTVRSTSKKAE
jgi:hypothetical protein